MSNLEIIDRQYEIIQTQNDIIKAQTQVLEQLGTVVMEDERAAVQEKLSGLLGVNELPDVCASACHPEIGQGYY